MASINFTQPAYTNNQKKYRYSDVHLDMIENRSVISSSGSDIKADYDTDAIKNSIHNIFNTRRGERILTPLFGVSLESYLFEPVSATTAYNIGKDIETGINDYEPRVVILNIDVKILDTEDGYAVSITLFIPKLNINTVVDTSLTHAGFNIK